MLLPVPFTLPDLEVGSAGEVLTLDKKTMTCQVSRVEDQWLNISGWIVRNEGAGVVASGTAPDMVADLVADLRAATRPEISADMRAMLERVVAAAPLALSDDEWAESLASDLAQFSD